MSARRREPSAKRTRAGNRRITMGLPQVTALSISLMLLAAAGCSDEAPAAGESTSAEADGSTTDERADARPGFISGEIVLVNEPFSVDYSAGVPFGPGSHAVVEIWRAPWNIADSAAELVDQIRIDDVDGFPIRFEIPVPDELDRRDEYGQPVHDFLPSATVYLGESDDTTYVGDLTTEIWLTIDSDDELLVIPVVGLERCGSDSSGGVCAIEARPD